MKSAKTLTPILPFLTKEYQANLQGAPKDQQDRMGKVAFKNEGNAWKLEGQGWVPRFRKERIPLAHAEGQQ